MDADPVRMAAAVTDEDDGPHESVARFFPVVRLLSRPLSPFPFLRPPFLLPGGFSPLVSVPGARASIGIHLMLSGSI